MLTRPSLSLFSAWSLPWSSAGARGTRQFAVRAQSKRHACFFLLCVCVWRLTFVPYHFVSMLLLIFVPYHFVSMLLLFLPFVLDILQLLLGYIGLLCYKIHCTIFSLFVMKSNVVP